MCGIVGIFDIHAKRGINRNLLSRMNETQYHRGPDEFGLHIEPGLGFGHRRLSIIDISSGQQPLFNRDRSIVVTYNGEIYNFRELRKELEDLGYRFVTNSDTEIIVNGWSAWGDSCVDKFRGMFAFAVWDRNRETLFLARDRLGIKPLYYSQLETGHFIFGSELKSLLVHPVFPKSIDPTAIEDYFGFGYIPDPKTIFRNVYKLPPAHKVSIKRGQKSIEPTCYWDISFSNDTNQSEDELRDEIVYRLSECISMRMVSEVPLGAFLSGGIDSSAVVALMTNLSDQAVKSCSISFGDPAYNESKYAELVAEKYRTAHVVEQVDANDFDLIDKLGDLYDEPFADSSAIPTYRVCQLAKKRVTVVLSGDGGDENFAGYRRYRWHTYEEQMRSRLPKYLRQPLFRFLGNVYPKADWAPKFLRAKATFEAMARGTLDGYFHSISIFSEQMRDALFSARMHNELQGYKAVEVLRKHAKNSPTDDPLSLVQYLDLKTYIPGDILTKVDRSSMAHALEVRVPFLDHEFVDWISALSPRHKLKGREGKYLLKKSLEAYLPREILYRSKMGFAIPLAGWYRGPLKKRIDETIHSPIIRDSGYFNQRFLSSLVDQHSSGRRDHSASLWALSMFECFLRKHIA